MAVNEDVAMVTWFHVRIYPKVVDHCLSTSIEDIIDILRDGNVRSK